MATPQPPYGEPNPPPPGYYYPPNPPAYYPMPPQGYIPAPKRNGRVWWIVGGIVGGVVILGIVGLILLFASGFQSLGAPRDATTAYFAAVKAHNWDAAYDRLSAQLRATTKPADLEATWLRRERADGVVDHFSITNTSIRVFNGISTATVIGTLYYASGASDPKIITLVKEGDAWKLSALP